MNNQSNDRNSAAATSRRARSEEASPSYSSNHDNDSGAKNPQGEKRKPPIFQEPGLAIWLKDKTSEKQADYYVRLTNSFASPFFAGASEEKPVTFTAFATLKNGPRLAPSELAQIIKGKDLVERQFVSAKRNTIYMAALAVQGIDRSPWKMDPTKFNQTLTIGRAFALTRSAANQAGDEHERVQWGWEAGGVVFPLRVKHGDQSLTFTPAHLFQCLGAKGCQIDGHSVQYAGAHANSENDTPQAKLQITSPQRELAQRPQRPGPAQSIHT